jgi:hypothetical protein
VCYMSDSLKFSGNLGRITKTVLCSGCQDDDLYNDSFTFQNLPLDEP